MRRALAVCIVVLVVARCGVEESKPVPQANDGILRVVVLGDSVAHGAGDERGLGIAGSLEQHDRTASVVNLGINGARTSHVRTLLERDAARAEIARADVVVLSIGGNDLYGDVTAQLFSKTLPTLHQVVVVNRVREVVDDIRTLNPSARIDVLGIYNPYRATAQSAWIDREVNRWDARLIAEFASQPNVTVIRIADLLRQGGRLSPVDHFHPSATGYEAIAERVRSSW